MWLLLKMVWIWKTTKAFDVLHIYPSAKELGEQSVLLCECVCICNNTWNKLCPASLEQAPSCLDVPMPCLFHWCVCVWTGGAGRGRNGIHREEIGAGLGGEDKREINGEEEINWCVEIRHPPPPPKKIKKKKYEIGREKAIQTKKLQRHRGKCRQAWRKRQQRKENNVKCKKAKLN